MPIIKAIENASQFRDQFRLMGRGDQFSYEGLGLLFDYFDDMVMAIELDVIGICCSFAEDTPEGIAHSYGIDLSYVDGSDVKQTIMDFLSDNTYVVGETSSGAFVYQQF